MKKLLLLSLNIAFLFGFIFSSCGSKPVAKKREKTVHVTTVKAVGDTLQETLLGKTKAIEELSLAFQVGGRIQKFNIDNGKKFQKGQFFATLDPTQYQLAVNKTKAEYEYAKFDYEAGQKMIKSNAISQKDFQRLESSYHAAKAAYDNAKVNLSYTVLRAPFDGVISHKVAEGFDEVAAGTPIATYLNLQQIEVVVYIPESIALWRDYFKNYQVSFGAIPHKTFGAKFKNIELKTSPNLVVYPLYLIMDVPEEYENKIVAGMSASVDILMAIPERANYVRVPVASIFSKKPNVNSVWVLQSDKTVKQKDVVLGGMYNQDEVIITGGLNKGEMVVTAGVQTLQEGQKVTVLQ